MACIFWSAPINRTIPSEKGYSSTISASPMAAAMRSARESICRIRAISFCPSALATSVWVPTVRKLNTHKMLDSEVAPTPTAARETDPNREINEVSHKPVNGSATRESKRGSDMEKRVKCGDRTKG